MCSIFLFHCFLLQSTFSIIFSLHLYFAFLYYFFLHFSLLLSVFSYNFSVFKSLTPFSKYILTTILSQLSYFIFLSHFHLLHFISLFLSIYSPSILCHFLLSIFSLVSLLTFSFTLSPIFSPLSHILSLLFFSLLSLYILISLSFSINYPLRYSLSHSIFLSTFIQHLILFCLYFFVISLSTFCSNFYVHFLTPF